MLRTLSIEYILYAVPAILIAMTLHEFAHGFVSYKFGDDTPLYQGRLSLNPLHHIDPIGFLSLLLFGFGWAKPVQVNPYKYRDSKNGMIWTALAGPLMNFLISFISMFLWVMLIKFTEFSSNPIITYLQGFLSTSVTLNIGLGIFNLIPIPPLDGSKILLGLLPEELYFKLMGYERYLSLLLIILLFTGILSVPLSRSVSSIIDLYIQIFTPLM